VARNAYYRTAHWRALKQATHQRDGWRCTVPGCGSNKGLTADHVETRPKDADGPTRFDVLSNTRSLCGLHDRQAKEGRDGKRMSGGKFKVIGCDANGWPLDPNHQWKSKA
jgi:5-methylcytosine-specific restriction protein A